MDLRSSQIVEALLRYLFEPDELRLFLRKYTDPQVSDQLPGEGVSYAHLRHEAVATLARHGYIDPAHGGSAQFFKDLIGVRKEREAEILQACSALGIQISGPVPRLYLRQVDASNSRAIRRAFISYSRDDTDWASATALALEHADVEVYMDVQSIRSGANFKKQIEQAIDRVDRVILGWSASAAKSKWVRAEYRQALRVRTEELVDRFLVVELLDNTPLPRELRAINARRSFFRTATSYDTILSGLDKDDRLAMLRILERLPK